MPLLIRTCCNFDFLAHKLYYFYRVDSQTGCYLEHSFERRSLLSEFKQGYVFSLQIRVKPKLLLSELCFRTQPP